MDPAFFNILACPLCKGPLARSHEAPVLICKIDKLAFPIEEDGVAVLLADRARPWPEKPDKKDGKKPDKKPPR